MTHWLRIFGSVLIASGIGVFIVSALAGIAYYIYMLFVVQEYSTGIIASGAMLIVLGLVLRTFFKETPNK